MQGPLVSIITVCLNNVGTLPACLNSVKAQTYLNTEHIIIDGVSSDGSQELIEDYGPSHYKSEPDSGIYEAMNKGLTLAVGKFCLFLNADDKLASNQIIEHLVQAIKGHDLICAGVKIFKKKRLFRVYSARQFKPWMFTFGHQPPHPGFFCKTSILKELNGFQMTYQIAGDFDLMVRVFSISELKWTTSTLTAVNMLHGGASSGSFDKKKLMNIEIKRSLKENGRTAWTILIWAKYLVKIFQIRF